MVSVKRRIPVGIMIFKALKSSYFLLLYYTIIILLISFYFIFFSKYLDIVIFLYAISYIKNKPSNIAVSALNIIIAAPDETMNKICFCLSHPYKASKTEKCVKSFIYKYFDEDTYSSNKIFILPSGIAIVFGKGLLK